MRSQADCDKTSAYLGLCRGNLTEVAATNPQRRRALDLLKVRRMLRLKDFIAECICPETLARLVREEAVIRPARGLYQLADAPTDASHVLAEIPLQIEAEEASLSGAFG